MNKSICLFLLLGFSIQGLAAGTENANTINQIKSYFFDDAAKSGSFTQSGSLADSNGKPTNKPCKLRVSLTSASLDLALMAGGTYVSFQANVSDKTSSKLNIVDADEDYIISSQVLLGEGGKGERKEYLNASTLERVGDPQVNNVSSIQIKNTPGESLSCVFSAVKN